MERFQAWLSDWLLAFPEGRPWVPLLLASSATEDPKLQGYDAWMADRRRSIGRVLWEWRDAPIAEDWLQGSDVCVSQFLCAGYDTLKVTRRSLETDGAAAWGITAEQHADLLAWCARMMARRTELKAAKKD